MNEGALRGEKLSFPVTLETIQGFNKVSVTFDTLEDLIEQIDTEVKSEINKDKKLSQICEELGLWDTITLLDARTTDLLTMYNYYSSNATPPAPFDSQIWLETVILMDKLQPRLI